MKDIFCAIIGTIGAAVAAAVGGWDAAMTTLVIFMSVDFLTGWMVAGLFHASRKTEHGGLESRAGWKGLVRKGVTLLIVLIAGRLDIMLDLNYVKTAAIIAFCANELLSITENAALMGIPMPKPIEQAIELLRSKADPPPLDKDVDYKAGYFVLLDELEKLRAENSDAKTDVKTEGSFEND